jgi:hypothetical protein
MMIRGISVTLVLVLAAVALFVVAFIVSVTDYGSHWAAWVTAGLAVFALAHVPWRVP